jgi:hypothetical protein
MEEAPSYEALEVRQFAPICLGIRLTMEAKPHGRPHPAA